MKITVGADPELFIRDSRTGAVHPACGMFGGTKGNTVPIAGLPDSFGLQEDNVMLEFNIPPVRDAYHLTEVVGRAVRAITDLVRTKEGYEVDKAVSRLFSNESLRMHPGAMQFGCSPDYDAYNMGAPLPPLALDLLNEGDGAWRFCGGHVHIGYPTHKDIPHHVVAGFCDVFIGGASIGDDQQGKRRTFYGSAGRYRPTKYGIEYRTLSNYWIWHDATIEMIGRQAFRVGHLLSSVPQGVLQQLYMSVPWGDLREGINTENVELVNQVLDEFDRKMDAEGINL